MKRALRIAFLPVAVVMFLVGFTLESMGERRPGVSLTKTLAKSLKKTHAAVLSSLRDSLLS